MKENKKWVLINESCENMIHVGHQSVDIIISSITFNVGLIYGKHQDKKPFEQYTRFMKKVVRECFNVLKSDGIMIIEVADTVVSDGYYVQLASMIQSLCLETGFHLFGRHMNFLNSENFIEYQNDGFDQFRKNVDQDGIHSNSVQWLIFKKEPTQFQGGNLHYIKYPNNHANDDQTKHPCPFTKEIIDKLLELSGFIAGQTVLDPFAGTARLGQEVIKRGGQYIGYEIDEYTYRKAKTDLKKIL